jgi:hypothetical protein
MNLFLGPNRPTHGVDLYEISLCSSEGKLFVPTVGVTCAVRCKTVMHSCPRRHGRQGRTLAD